MVMHTERVKKEFVLVGKHIKNTGTLMINTSLQDFSSFVTLMVFRQLLIFQVGHPYITLNDLHVYTCILSYYGNDLLSKKFVVHTQPDGHHKCLFSTDHLTIRELNITTAPEKCKECL